MDFLVYRIEDKNGTGPYQGKTSADNSWLNKSICNHNADKRPGPWQCTKIREMDMDYLKKHYFGFSTIKQLERWFTKTDRELLHNNGYRIAIYKVPKEYYMKATNQCVFIKEYSTLIKNIDLIKGLKK